MAEKKIPERYFLQFNQWEFRVVALADDHTYLRAVGKPSQELQLAMRSAAQELGGLMLTIPLEAHGK